MEPDSKGCVATIGSFDGVHLGHSAILDQVLEHSHAYSLPSVVMFFEPQPREFFSGEQAPARLMRWRDKYRAIVEKGIDSVFCLQFNSYLRSLTADEFVERVLVEGLGVRSLVVGDDFRFGKGRGGDYALLQSRGRELGFDVLDTRTLTYRGERISSTRIREALEVDNFELAEALLGRPFVIEGRVVYGNQLGRTINVPTANVDLHRYATPLSGVYAVTARLADGRVRNGVANIGLRPTVEERVKPILEVHLLDFEGNLYGQRIIVQPLHKIREEKKFETFEALRDAIYSDIEESRTYFADANVD